MFQIIKIDRLFLLVFQRKGDYASQKVDEKLQTKLNMRDYVI